MGLLPPPHAYFTHQFTESLVLGVGVNVPFGLKTQWANPETYSGRFISQMAELRGYSVNPSVGYRVADRFAVGGGLDLRLSKVRLERRVPVINPFTFRGFAHNMRKAARMGHAPAFRPRNARVKDTRDDVTGSIG